MTNFAPARETPQDNGAVERRGLGCSLVFVVVVVLCGVACSMLFDYFNDTYHTLTYQDFEIELDEQQRAITVVITRPESLDQSPFEIRLGADGVSHPIYRLPESVVVDYVKAVGGEIEHRTPIGDDNGTRVTDYSIDRPDEAMSLIYRDGNLQRGYLERPIIKLPSETTFSALPVERGAIVERLGKPMRTTTRHHFRHPFRITAY